MSLPERVDKVGYMEEGQYEEAGGMLLPVFNEQLNDQEHGSQGKEQLFQGGIQQSRLVATKKQSNEEVRENMNTREHPFVGTSSENVCRTPKSKVFDAFRSISPKTMRMQVLSEERKSFVAVDQKVATQLSKLQGYIPAMKWLEAVLGEELPSYNVAETLRSTYALFNCSFYPTLACLLV